LGGRRSKIKEKTGTRPRRSTKSREIRKKNGWVRNSKLKKKKSRCTNWE